MIFKEIHIDGFGIFNGFSLPNLKKGVNIILGNNEVGKSTLLKFLRFTLFGYPSRTDQRMSPLNGGKHGGRIKALLASGKEVTFERFAGSKGGDINLIYDRNPSQNQSRWSQLLGNATAELYNNVYAFSLDELVNLDSLSSSGVEDKIFSVGLGLGDTSIGKVESSIQSRVDQIYTLRGSKQQIPAILKEIQSKKLQIQKIQDNLPYYQELTRDIKKIEDEISGIERKLEKSGAARSKLDNYLKCYDSFISVISVSEELQKLPELRDYPEKGTEQLDKLEDKEQELSDRIRELRTGNRAEKGIEELDGAIKAISFNSELLKHEDKIEYLRENLALYKQTLNDKNDDDGKVEKINQSINQGINKISAGWTEHNIAGFTNLISHKSRIEGFKEQFEEADSEKRTIEAELKALRAKESAVNMKKLADIVSLILLIGSIPAFYYALPVLGAALLLIALLLFAGKRFFLKVEDSQSEAQKQLEKLNSNYEILNNEYKEYLGQNLNLPIHLSTNDILEIFRTIEQIQKEISEREGLNKKQKTQRTPFIQKFVREANSLKEIIQNHKPNENVEVLVNQIIAEFDASQRQLQEKEKLLENFNRKQKELETATLMLAENREQIAELLESVNAADRQDFRKKYKINGRVNELIDKKNREIQTIEKIVGLNNAAEVIEFFKTNEKQEVEKNRSDLTSQIHTLNAELKAKNSTLGEKKNEFKRIEGESELAQVMTELETEKQKLNNAYRDWLSGKIALKILGDVKTKYEKEQQPEVIKNSSAYFGKITRDRYKRISVSLDEKAVVVFDSSEASKKIEQLSRGTKEQLLISLRLGFIEEYEKQAEPLPIIVDEVLVNFDPYRARQTAEILREFGKDRQILIFTCHPDTKDYFGSAVVNLTRINENGQPEKWT
ncbi:MAG: AAA family ATPase [Candidatus Marinimicrobia bacterium]|nr:AAA family ATPase [Candidatus Neomarinimicrobiota bacterium]